MQSLWLADAAAQDGATGKVNLAGLFDQIEVEAGTDFTAPAVLFFALRGIHGRVRLTLLYADVDGDVLLEHDIEVPGEPLVTATVCRPIPRIPVPDPGVYTWELHFGDGEDILGSARVTARYCDASTEGSSNGA